MDLLQTPFFRMKLMIKFPGVSLRLPVCSFIFVGSCFYFIHEHTRLLLCNAALLLRRAILGSLNAGWRFFFVCVLSCEHQGDLNPRDESAAWGPFWCHFLHSEPGTFPYLKSVSCQSFWTVERATPRTSSWANAEVWQPSPARSQGVRELQCRFATTRLAL